MVCKKRFDHESQEDYREWHRHINRAMKQWLKGKVIWHSATQGTYVKALHGPIGTQR